MPVSSALLVPQHLRAIIRSGIRPVREFSHTIQILGQRGADPLVAFLPCEGRRGAALLRCFNMADALKARNWRTITLAPSLTLNQRRRLLRIAKPDLVVMQGSRHFLNRPDYYPDHRILYDLDDADFHLPHLTRPVRAAMPKVSAVISGSEYIANWCQAHGAAQARVVWTGMPVSDRISIPHHDRRPVIAWAQSRPMTYTREAAWVRDVVHAIARQRPGIVLRLFDRQSGDTSEFANSFRAKGVSVEWVKAKPFSDYLTDFDDVSLGFAPLSADTPFSRGKSFGKILSYLDRRVPVFASGTGEPTRFFTSQTGVCSNDPDVWCREALRLLGDVEARQSMADAAYAAFKQQLSSDAVARSMDIELRRFLSMDCARVGATL